MPIGADIQAWNERMQLIRTALGQSSGWLSPEQITDLKEQCAEIEGIIAELMRRSDI